MNKEIKQKITRNWFKLLQDVICKDIQKLENNKIKFVSKTWNRNKLKDDDVLNDMTFAGAAKRLVDVNEVANLAIYLCSNLSSGITGSILKVDCGASLDA